MSKDQILVKDIMTKDVVSVRPETPLLEASQILVSHNFNGMPVIDEDEKVVGIITEFDFLSKGTSIHLPTFIRLFGKYPDGAEGKKGLIGEDLGNILSFTVNDVMNKDPLVMHQNDSLQDIILQFSQHHRVNPIPIVDEKGRLVGVMSRYDIIRYYAKALGKVSGEL